MSVWAHGAAGDGFEPTRAAALARVAAIDPAAYARTRNALDGTVTRLSPYITHGFISLPEVAAKVASRHPLGVQHKLVFEWGWREYFRHVWQIRGEGIFRSLHPGVLPDEAYAPGLPADVRHACTGVPVVDLAVRTLYASGYLHNHARLWLASYVVHVRKVHWQVGADWMYGHLLDGDLASNHLSWQWVAGTASRQPYLFNADNVARHAPAPWHSAGTVLDADYGVLDALARRPVSAPAGGAVRPDPLDAPPLLDTPPGEDVDRPAAEEMDRLVRGRDVWLVHPWALNDPPPDLPPHTLVLAVVPRDVLARRPWSERRWAFVGARMRALASWRWCLDAPGLAQMLRAARTVQTVDDAHIAHWWPSQVTRRPEPRLFASANVACDSFSRWWARVTRGHRSMNDLPGLRGWDGLDPQGACHEPQQRLVVGTDDTTDGVAHRPGHRRSRWHRP